MKKISYSIRLLAIIIGLLLFINIPVFATTGKSTGANVRVRKSASTEAEVIDLLGVEDTVEILSEEGDWYKISFKGQTGYVAKTFINTNEENSGNTNNQGSQNNTNNENVSNPDENNNQNSGDNANQDNGATNNQPNENTVVSKIYKMAEKTNLNILPVVTSELIGEVQKDDEVTLISNAGLWAFIKTEKVAGWIRIDKLSTENVTIDNGKNVDNEDNENSNDENTENDNDSNTDNNTQDENTENNKDNNETNTNYTAKTMYSNSTSVNVRSESNTSSDVVDSLSINTQVNVVGEENGWYKVEFDGKSGYIRKDLLSDEKSEVSSRSNEIDRSALMQQANNSEEQPSTTNVSSTNIQIPAQESNYTPESSGGVTGNDIVEYAKQFLGCSYVYGASGPSSFDCSGLTMYVYKHFGYSLSHSSKVQATQGVAVTGDLQAGDILVFSNDGRTIGHVGIYIGNDQFIHASDSSTGVIISRLSDSWNKSKYRGARRIL